MEKRDSTSDYDKMKKDSSNTSGLPDIDKPTVDEIREGTAQAPTSTGQSA